MEIEEKNSCANTFCMKMEMPLSDKILFNCEGISHLLPRMADSQCSVLYFYFFPNHQNFQFLLVPAQARQRKLSIKF